VQVMLPVTLPETPGIIKEGTQPTRCVDFGWSFCVSFHSREEWEALVRQGRGRKSPHRVAGDQARAPLLGELSNVLTHPSPFAPTPTCLLWGNEINPLKTCEKVSLGVRGGAHYATVKGNNV